MSIACCSLVALMPGTAPDRLQEILIGMLKSGARSSPCRRHAHRRWRYAGGVMKRLITLALGATFLTASLAAATQEASAQKSDLRVLLVSHDPAAPKLAFASMADERTLELYKERASAFETFLKEHFESVQLVYGDSYTAAMSDAVDVTLFDARPKALSPAGEVTDPETGETSHQRASYLPESFSRPALMIAENSPLIGEPIGLKLDWL